MARADSTIRVNIIGDAKSLGRAADNAGDSVKGMNRTLVKAGVVVAGAFAVDALVDFGNTAAQEADRVADAAGRIESQLGPELSKSILDRADDFTKIGASKGDMLELEARLIDIGTAAGIADDELAPMSESAAETASALALITDTDAATWIDKIGKAAGSGDARSLRDLGVHLDDAAVAAQALADTGKPTVDALTEGELAAARMKLIMEQLAPRIAEVKDGEGDLEQKQSELDAKMENFSAKVGPAVEDAMSGILDFVLRGIEGWETLAEKLGDAAIDFGIVEDAVRNLLGPLALAWESVQNLIDALTHLDRIWGGSAVNTRGTGFVSPRGPAGNFGGGTVNVNVQGGSPETIERAVRDATRTTARRG